MHSTQRPVLSGRGTKTKEEGMGTRTRQAMAYVCSPYRGDIERNTEYAAYLTRRAVEAGLLPITPHLYLTRAFDDDDPDGRAAGTEAGIGLLGRCDMVLLGDRYGISEGMRAELESARSMMICVVTERDLGD
jgi:hypothetical protein